ncbi:MAG: hypothetical protein ACRC3G_08345 [Bacteroidales bacterium]
MEYGDIFIPVSEPLQKQQFGGNSERINNHLKFGIAGFEWEWLGKFKIALIGLRKVGAPNSFTPFREALYRLYAPTKMSAIIDLGDIELTTTTNNERVTYALQKVFSQGLLPLVFCENIHSSTIVYDALKVIKKKTVASFILPHANLGDSAQPLCEGNTLAYFLRDSKRELEALNVLGYQSYLTASLDIQQLQSQYCELLRLGVIRDAPTIAEPLLRSTHLIALALNAIRASDAIAANQPQPNGLYAEEACRIMRQVALSNSMTAVYIGGFSLLNDQYGTSAKLIAQLIWHVIEGHGLRINESPDVENSCRKIEVQIGQGQKIVFYQGKITQRWWMQVPIQTNTTCVIPCLSHDYDKAAHGEIPTRWLWFYKKMDNRELNNPN